MLMTKYIYPEHIVIKDSQMISLINRKHVHYSLYIYLPSLRFFAYSYALRYILSKETCCFLKWKLTIYRSARIYDAFTLMNETQCEVDDLWLKNYDTFQNYKAKSLYCIGFFYKLYRCYYFTWAESEYILTKFTNLFSQYPHGQFQRNFAQSIIRYVEFKFV